MDAILRKARESEFAFAANDSQAHLDPDEMSAFAENALPETAKLFFTAHLADCDACRKKLSNLILLNAESESEDIRAEEIAAVSPTIPWYRKLFAFPNLAYTLGSMVLIFSGIIGFTILRNFNTSQNSQVSQSSERPNDTKETAASGDAAPIEMNSANVANTASNSNAASFNSSNPPTANISANRGAMNSNVSSTAGKQIASPSVAPQIETRREDDWALAKDERKIQLDGISAGSVSEQKPADKKDAEKNAATADAAESAPAPPETTQPSVTNNQINSLPKSARMQKSLGASVETTTVAGKTFNRRNNVWYDALYNGQSTTNFTRGTDEYKKLDRNLRAIVENLGGTIVVVWKEKAYRIQ